MAETRKDSEGVEILETNYPLVMLRGFMDKNLKDGGDFSMICGNSENGVKFEYHEYLEKIESPSTSVSIGNKESNQLGFEALIPFSESSQSTLEEKPSAISTTKWKSKEFIRCHCVTHDHQLNWPISENGDVKMFVPVKRGKNLILISSTESKNVLNEIRVIYEPLKNKRFIRPVYIICEGSDGKFEAPPGEDNSVESAVQRISFNARILQTFTGENLNLHGFGRKSFRLEEDEEGNEKVHIFKSKLNVNKAHEMTGDELYRYFHKELSESEIFDPLCKFWTFMSCTSYKPPTDEQEFDKSKISEYVKGHTALGGTNLALFGTGCLHTWARNLGELVERFSDERKIDCKKLFDDSCNRGYHWANYSTTLGAAIHELGHTFNLPHTSSGIMGRGFDDMNCFFTCQKNGVSKLKTDAKGSPYLDFGAHWHRSSAAILNYSRWFGNRDDDAIKEIAFPTMSSDINSIGPVGGGCKADESGTFDVKKWLEDGELEWIGIRIKAGEFVDAVQFIGSKNSEEISTADEATALSSALGEVSSPWFGNENSNNNIYEFYFNNIGENLVSIDVRAGEWVDAIRIHTNLKSSVWTGGDGGDLYTLRPQADRKIVGLFGTAAKFVTSLGVNLNSCKNELEDDEKFQFNSIHGVRVIEVVRENGEVLKHWEFHDEKPATSISIPKEDVLMGGMTETVAVYDDAGEKSNFKIKNFIKGIGERTE